MPPTKHSMLGASKAAQWLGCPPSVLWEQQFPEPPSSEAAEEGTLAHAIAEEHLRRILAGKKVATSKKLKEDPLYRPVMEEHVATYTDYIMEELTAARAEDAAAVLVIEERIDFSAYVPDGFGTADCIMIAGDHLQVFDFKYGKGVPVEAYGNPQLRLYGVGALLAYNVLYDIRKVTMHIIQPRLDSITSETLTADELMEWAEKQVAPKAALAAKGEGEHTPGEHCRWCRCKNVCRAYAQEQLRLAKLQFDEPDHVERGPYELSPEEIAEILSGVDSLTRWAKGIKEWALEQAVHNGASFPGYKVVLGRSNRIIANEAAALEALDAAGFTPDRVTKLKGLGDLEDVVGVKKLAELLGDLIVKPSGKPVLAPDTDKRPAYNSAKSIFEPIED